MASSGDHFVNSFNPTHQLVEVVAPNAGVVLSSEGESANLTRNTRVVSDRVIFVDNISDSLAKEDFVTLIKQFARRGAIVDVRFLKRTKGGSFAFIEFEDEEDGREAISGLNSKDFENTTGQELDFKATKAENPTEMVSNKNLYVKGIPTYWTSEDLQARFSGYGGISHCRTLKRDGDSRENTGVGFVHFFAAIDAARAIEGVDEQLVDPEDESLGVLEVKFARAKTRNNSRRGGNRRRYNNGGYYNRRGAHGGDFNHNVPNWNFGRGEGGRNYGGGRGMGRNRGDVGNWNNMYPNEEMWAKMVEVMQNMSLWQTQNPYQTYPQYPQYQNYQNPSIGDSADRHNPDNNQQNYN